MTAVGAYEAKTHQPGLPKRGEGGGHSMIARHGTPVAALIPVGEYPRLDPAAAAAALKESARGHGRGDLDVRAAIEDGRS